MFDFCSDIELNAEEACDGRHKDTVIEWADEEVAGWSSGYASPSEKSCFNQVAYEFGC